MKKILLAAIIFISALSTVYSQCTIANVAITGPTPISICEGTPQILSGTVTVTALPQNGSFTYSWIKTGTVSVLVPATTITIPANVATTIPSYTGITGALSDAGTYVLRIEDGNTGNSACYAEVTVVVNITPKPIITSAETGTICSGVAQNYAITSNVPSSYTWTRATVTGITLTTGSGSTSPITETLTLGAAITHPTAVVYKITPTSTAGSCLGTTFDYTVTVNPTPAITSSATGKICTGAALNYLITSNIPSSYTWTRAAIPTINAGIPGSGSTNTITETLISTASIPEVIRYVITPTSITGSCEGTPFNYDVSTTAIATPTVTVASNPGTTICTGTAVTFNANAGNGGIPTYKWTSSVNGVLASTTDSYSSSSLVDGEVIAVEISSSLACVVPKTATASLTMKVNPNVTPSVTVTADKTSICPGDQVIFTATPVNGGTPTYVWKDGTTIVGGSGSTYTTTDLTPGNSITVTMTSAANCTSLATATSTPVSVTVIPAVTPTVSIAPTPTIICSGLDVTFNATITNEGTNPSYAWKINGQNPTVITTMPSFTTSALTSSSDVVTVELTSNALCAYPKKVTSTGSSLTVLPGIGAGTIGSDQTICYNAIPNPITQLTPATGVTTAVVYTWESSTDGVTFTPIPDIGQDITPPALTQTTWYRRTATDPTLPAQCNTAKTYSVKITVNPNLAAGTIGSDQSICAGLIPIEFTNVSLPTGGSGIYKYQWQSDENGTMTNIANATNATFAPTTALTVTTHFQRVETTMAGSTTCKTVGSNIVTVTVKIPEEITVTLNNPGQLCAGTSYSFEATANTTGTGTLSYKWSIGGLTQTGTTSTFVYNPVNIDNGKIIIVQVSTSNSCSTGKGSANAVLTIDPCDGSFSTFISGPNPITPGQQNAVYRVANQTDFSYEWTITGGTIVSGQNTNAVTIDWDAAPGNATGRTALPSYSISVKETNKDKQSKTTTLELNTLTTGVAKSFAQSGINLFPNPTAESFSIDMPESGIAVSYEILDLTGASVAQGNFISTGTAEKITANIDAGMYQVVLRYNDVITTGRLSKVQ